MTFPQPVFSPVVTAGGITLAFEASATSTGETITGPAAIQSGDFLALFDVAQSGGGGPDTVVPSGFSIAQNILGNSDTLRAILSYKIADGSESSSSLTGMSGSSVRKILLVFRPSSALSSASHDSGGAEVTSGDPSSQSVTASSGTAPLVVFAGYYANASIDPRTFTPAKDDEVQNNSIVESWFAYRIDNESPSDTTVDMEDEGSVNVLVSTYVQVS